MKDYYENKGFLTRKAGVLASEALRRANNDALFAYAHCVSCNRNDVEAVTLTYFSESGEMWCIRCQ